MPVQTTKFKGIPNAAKTSLQGTTPIETTFDKTTISRLEKYKDAKGLLKIQEVIRLSVGVFLDKQGY